MKDRKKRELVELRTGVHMLSPMSRFEIFSSLCMWIASNTYLPLPVMLFMQSGLSCFPIYMVVIIPSMCGYSVLHIPCLHRVSVFFDSLIQTPATHSLIFHVYFLLWPMANPIVKLSSHPLSNYPLWVSWLIVHSYVQFYTTEEESNKSSQSSRLSVSSGLVEKEGPLYDDSVLVALGLYTFLYRSLVNSPCCFAVLPP